MDEIIRYYYYLSPKLGSAKNEFELDPNIHGVNGKIIFYSRMQDIVDKLCVDHKEEKYDVYVPMHTDRYKLKEETIDNIVVYTSSEPVRVKFVGMVTIDDGKWGDKFERILMMDESVDLRDILINSNIKHLYSTNENFEWLLDHTPLDRIFISSDWHIFKSHYKKEKNLVNVEKIVDWCIENIKPSDLFIYLGDISYRFASKEDQEKSAKIMKSIPGHKCLILGNHDIFLDEKYYSDCGFEYIFERYDWSNIIFTHRPLDMTLDKNRINIHGHMHDEVTYRTSEGKYNINVYPSFYKNKPVSLQYLLDNKDKLVKDHVRHLNYGYGESYNLYNGYGELLLESTTKKHSVVYFSKNISSDIIRDMIMKFKSNLAGKVAVKLHFGEKGNKNYIDPFLLSSSIKALEDNGYKYALVDCNTAYGGSRDKTEDHIAVAKEHGFGDYNIDILDGNSCMMLINPKINDIKKELSKLDSDSDKKPYELMVSKDGPHLEPIEVGDLSDYGSMIVYTHFKGHEMAGYGGAIKNIGMGLATGKLGKKQIHRDWKSDRPFLERLTESAYTIQSFFGKNRMIYVNILSNISLECDCHGDPKVKPVMKDIGVLVSDDIIAIEQASIDLIRKADDNKELLEQIMNRAGTRVIQYGEWLNMGTRDYILKNFKDSSVITLEQNISEGKYLKWELDPSFSLPLTVSDQRKVEYILNSTPLDRIWISTDWHLFKPLKDGEMKPFEPMDLVKWCCDNILPSDVFIYLGDLGYKKASIEEQRKTKAVFRTIPGQKILVVGNHDFLLSKEFYMDCGFDFVTDELIWNKMIFTHFPINAPSGYINIHGHIHDKVTYWTSDGGKHNLNTYPSFFDNKPVSLKYLLDHKREQFKSHIYKVTESINQYEPNYFYHLVSKGVLKSNDSITSLDYQYHHNIDLFRKNSEKYRDRLCNGWNIYPNREPKGLTDKEVYEGINKFRHSSNGNNQIYLFKYPPYITLGRKMQEILKYKDIYRIDINNPEIQKLLSDIDYGYIDSSTDKGKLTSDYYETIKPQDYFSKYNETSDKPLFAPLHHISISPISGYIPLKYWEKIDTPKNIEDVERLNSTTSTINESYLINDNDIVYNFDAFLVNETNVVLTIGYSGSGKTTLTNILLHRDKDYHLSANVYEIPLDALIMECSGYHNTVQNYPVLSKFYTDIGYKLMKKYNNYPINTVRNIIYSTFMDWFINFAKTCPNTRFILDGVWPVVFADNPAKYKDWCIIIKGTSYFNSVYGASSRDQENNSELIQSYPSKFRRLIDYIKRDFDPSRAYVGLTTENEKTLTLWQNYFIHRKTAAFKEEMIDESNFISHLDNNYKSKEKLNLSSFKPIKVDKSVYDKYISQCKDLKYCDYKKDTAILFIDKEDNVVALLAVDPLNHGDNEKWISIISVSKQYRSHGLSSQLLDYCVNKLKATALGVYKDNEVALKIYKDYGFKISPESQKEVDSGKSKRYRMYLNKNINENYIVSRDDVYYNYDEFKYGGINLAIVVGFSGSGKTTFGRDLASRDDSIVNIELDKVLNSYMFKYDELDDIIKEFFNSSNGSRFKITKDFIESKSKEEVSRFFNDYHPKILMAFCKFMETYSKRNNNKRFILEGLWPLYYNIDPQNFRGWCIIIKGTSYAASLWRSVVRDAKNFTIFSRAAKLFETIIDFKNYGYKINKYMERWIHFVENQHNELVEESSTNINKRPSGDIKCIHLSSNLNLDGATFSPRVPKCDFISMGLENGKIPRVCFTECNPFSDKSIDQALAAIIDYKAYKEFTDKKYGIYTVEGDFNKLSNSEIVHRRYVMDACVTKEMWALEPVKLKKIGEIFVTSNIKKEISFHEFDDDSKPLGVYRTYEWHYV